MKDLAILRLYAMYKNRNAWPSHKEEQELLQVAKAVGDDLTEDEFMWLAEQVAALVKERDERRFQQKSDVPATQNHWVTMANKEYQERLWELPSLVRQHEKPFIPARLADGNPIDIDKNAPEESEERLKKLPYDAVKHDPRLRDAWHAAQAGKLATLLRNDEVWKSYTDPKVMGEAVKGMKINPRTVPAGLRMMLAFADAGLHKAELSPTITAQAANLPTNRVYKYDPEIVVSRLLDKKEGAAKTWQDHYIHDAGLDKIQTKTPLSKVKGQDPDSVKSWVKEIREHHEMQTRQFVVNSQLENYRPQSTASSKPLDVQSVREAAVQNATESVATNPGIVEQLVPPVGDGLMDKLQTVLDGIGVADPTPLVDGVNAAISLVRAFRDPANAGTHLLNAGTSAVSMVPYIGDLAKVFKYGGKAGKAASNGASPISDFLKNLPVGMADRWGPASGGSGGGSSIPPAGGGSGMGSGGGSGGSGGFGGLPLPSGSGWLVGGLAVAVAAAVGDMFHRMKSANKLMQPDQYTGNSFDSASNMAGKGMDAFNTAAPFGMKWGVFGWTLGLVTKQLQGWIEWLKKIEDAGNKIIDTNRNLANYNGTIAAAFAQLDADRIRRDIGRASSLGGQLKGLAANQSEFEAAKQDLFEPFEKLQIAIQSKLTWIGTKIIQGIDSIEVISESIDWFLGKDEADGSRSALESAIQKHVPQVKDKLK